MIRIKKGREPGKLLWYRQQDGASYEQMDKEVREELIDQLLREQGHLCAYCMRRIDSPSVVRIEHCRPRHPKDEIVHDKKATLDFKWMLGVCYGNSLVKGVKTEDTTCDAHRKNTELTINPFDEVSVRKIKYKADGSIYSEDEEINKDVTDTLNLNCPALSLPLTRKKVLSEAQKRIVQKCAGKSQDAYVHELERTYTSLVQERNLTPYCGIIISWLEGKLKK